MNPFRKIYKSNSNLSTFLINLSTKLINLFYKKFMTFSLSAIQRKWRKEKSPLRNNILKPLYFHNTNNFMNFTNFMNFMYYT